MRRLAVWLTFLALAGISSGGLDYLHQLDHQRQAALWAAALQAAAGKHGPAPSAPRGNLPDAANCLICATLHAPLATQAFQIIIAAMALIIIASRIPPPTVVVARIALPIECRGPPYC
jgi:hypothetical protein